MEWALPAGRVRVSAQLDLAPVGPAAGTAALQVGEAVAELALERLEAESGAGRTVPVTLEVAHPGGPLALTLSARGRGPRVWLSELRIEGP
jgi:hypothetical protein